MATIPRCCRDTLTWRVGNMHGPLVDDTEIPCRWCDGVWTFRDGQWTYRDAVAQTGDRMVASLPAVRARLAEERQRREATSAPPATRACDTCGHRVVTAPADNVCPTCSHDFTESLASGKAEPQGTLADLQMEMDRSRGKQWKDM